MYSLMLGCVACHSGTNEQSSTAPAPIDHAGQRLKIAIVIKMASAVSPLIKYKQAATSSNMTMGSFSTSTS